MNKQQELLLYFLLMAEAQPAVKRTMYPEAVDRILTLDWPSNSRVQRMTILGLADQLCSAVSDRQIDVIGGYLVEVLSDVWPDKISGEIDEEFVCRVGEKYLIFGSYGLHSNPIAAEHDPLCPHRSHQ